MTAILFERAALSVLIVALATVAILAVALFAARISLAQLRTNWRAIPRPGRRAVKLFLLVWMSLGLVALFSLLSLLGTPAEAHVWYRPAVVWRLVELTLSQR